jgi:hypothetical protein
MDDMGRVIGFFRMNENAVCRSVIIDVIRSLGVRAISYSFDSVPLRGCRTTGTAISIVDSSAIALEEINAYSDVGNIEGQASVTPFVRRLFNEAKSDFLAQSLLASMDVWKSFRKDFDFFDNSNEVADTTYEQWKSEHILKCGPVWSIEAPNPKAQVLINERQNVDPDVAELLIRVSVTYRDRYDRIVAKLQTVPPDFNPLLLKKIKMRHPGSINLENARRVYIGQALQWTPDRDKDKVEYLEILNECLALYADESNDFLQIMQGQCGLEYK